MNQSEYTFLRKLTNMKYPTVHDLKEIMDMNQNQIYYLIRRINEELRYLGLSEINQYKDGNIHFDRRDFAKLLDKEAKGEIDLDYTSKEIRHTLIMFIMLAAHDYISLADLCAHLHVSKNTVITDIKELNGILEKDNLEIIYSRKSGYFMQGSEWQNRVVAEHMCQRIVELPHYLEIFEELTGLDKDRVQTMQYVMKRLEKELHVKYVDNRFQTVPLFLSLVDLRIKRGKRIKLVFDVGLSDMSDTKEFKVIEPIIDTYFGKELSDEEKLYIAIYIQSISRVNIEVNSEIKAEHLFIAIEQFLMEFELKSAIRFEIRDDLIQKLYVHLITAYYRIKYQFTNVIPMESHLSHEYEDIYSLVDSSIHPLEVLFDNQFPKQEIAYIALFIGSHMFATASLNSYKRDVSAIVVCKNGVIYSNIMKNFLINMFPWIRFVETMSLREYEQNTDAYSHVDVIFSSTPIQNLSGPKVIYIEDISVIDKEWLKDEVGYVVDGFERNQVVDEFISVVKHRLDIDNDTLNDLRYEFIQTLMKPKEQKTEAHSRVALASVISEDQIKYIDYEVTWTQALEIATEKLIERKDVEEEYLDVLLESYPNPEFNILLGGSIFIPHSSPNNGVNKLSMSILVLKYPVVVKEHPVHIISVIAPIDKVKHIKAMQELMSLSKNKETIERIIKATSSKEIHMLLVG